MLLPRRLGRNCASYPSRFTPIYGDRDRQEAAILLFSTIQHGFSDLRCTRRYIKHTQDMSIYLFDFIGHSGWIEKLLDTSPCICSHLRAEFWIVHERQNIG